MVHGYAFGGCSYTDIRRIVVIILNLINMDALSVHQMNDLIHYVYQTIGTWEEYMIRYIQGDLTVVEQVIDEYLDNLIRENQCMQRVR